MRRERRQLDGHRLYHAPLCTYCLFVRAALRWLRIDLPLANVLTDRRHLAELVEGGGKPQVPCLRIEQAPGEVRWLYESIDIIRYLKSGL